MKVPTEINRRQLLQGAVGGALLLGTSGALGDIASSVAGASSLPKKGGTLRAGVTGGSSSDTMNALTPIQTTDFARTLNLFEMLTVYGPTGKVEYLLAESMVPNATATAWTIHLRPGVTWHNGKAFTADDVIYTFQTITNPKSPMPGAPLLARVNVAGMKKLNDLTVYVPCHTPYSTLNEALAGWYFNMVPVGYDPKKPIGTGPFKAHSFTPGVESVFLRNENYWQSGLPYVDELIIQDYASETSQINALTANQVDVIDALSAASISAVKNGGGKVWIAKTSGFTPLYMRRDTAPFNNVDVTQAMRYVVDRPQMLEVIFGGHGIVGNDIYDRADPAYNLAIPQRVQDISKAKYLLKKAGQENLQVTLTAGPIGPGTVQLAQVYAEQASAAGIKVNIDSVTPEVEFGPNYAKFLFAQDYVIYTSYLTQTALSGLLTSPFPETHFSNAKYTGLFNTALATTDIKKRYDLEHEMQLIDWNEGGNIIPYFLPTIDGYRSNVHGIESSVTGWPLAAFNFKSMWLS